MMTNEQSNHSHIEVAVMRRVHRIHTLQYFINGFTASCLLLLLTLYGIGRQVFVARVFENAPQDLASALQFYLAAFTNTEFVVQALTLVTLASFFYFARATARVLSGALTPVHV